MDPFQVSRIRINEPDANGLKVKSIYARFDPRYAVYRTEERVTIQFADDPVRESEQREKVARLSPLRGEINGLVDGWRTHKRKRFQSAALRYDRRVADTLIVALEGDVESALLILPQIRDDVVAERKSYARFMYLVYAACGSRLAAVTDYPCAFVVMNSTLVRYASRSKALRDLNAWVELKVPIPADSLARKLIEEAEWSGKDSEISQDVWFRDWPKGYDLTELSKHYPDYDETFSLLWFEQDSGPDAPVKNWHGVPQQEDDGGLKELDGTLSFSKRTRRGYGHGVLLKCTRKAYLSKPYFAIDLAFNTDWLRNSRWHQEA
jgi:hypothetical protein